MLVRGDTDFTQTKHLDRWDDDGVQFIFGIDATPNLHVVADDLPAAAWKPLTRPPRYEVKTQPRQRPENVKEQIVVAAGIREHPPAFRSRWRSSTIARRPAARAIAWSWCARTCRWRRASRCCSTTIATSSTSPTTAPRPAAEVVFAANDRCNQENLHAQLKHGVCALHAPVDNLVSNWAYMVMTALAWNLKAWLALQLPETAGRWAERHRSEKQAVLRMEFKTFVNAFMRLPCQIVRTSRGWCIGCWPGTRGSPSSSALLDVLRC